MRSVEIYFFVSYVYLIGLCFRVYCQDVCSSCECSYIPDESLDCSGRVITNITECESLGDCRPVGLLNFSNNAITEVRNLSNLQLGFSNRDECYLDFSHNTISVFLPTTIDIECEYSSLTFDLSFNAFVNISSNSFRIFDRGTVRLEAPKLNFSSNKIRIVESSILGNVFVAFRISNLTIDLSSNEITTLHNRIFEFYGPYRVERFYALLNDNNIVSFPLKGIVQSIGYLVGNTLGFDLSNNDLSGLMRDNIEGISLSVPNIVVDLSRNRWNCNCTQRYVSDNSSDLRIILNDKMSVEPACAEPPRVSNRPLLSLSSKDFICAPNLDPETSLQLVVHRGETAQLYCPFKGADPPIERVEWEFYRGVSPEDTQVSLFRIQNTCANCFLLIENVQQDAVGEYRCTVSNGESLTITQTLRLAPIPATETTSPSTASTDDGTKLSTPQSHTGLIAVVIIVSVLLLLVSTSLAVVGHKFYWMRKSVAKNNSNVNATVAFKYRSKPPKAQQPFAQSSTQSSGQENQGVEVEEPYEKPCVNQTPSKSTQDGDIYEIHDCYVTN